MICMYLDWLDALSDHILRKLYTYIVLSREIILLLSSSPEKTWENLFCSLPTYDFLFNCWLWILKQCLLVLLSLTEYFSHWELLWDEVCPSAIEQQRLEVCVSPPQVRLTSLFSPSSFLLSKWEILIHCDLSLPFNRNDWNGPTVGENARNSPGRAQPDGNLGPTMGSKPSTTNSFIFLDTTCLDRQKSQTCHSPPQSTLILKSWVCCLSSCLLSFLSSLGLFNLCFSLSPLSAPLDQ